MTPGAVGRGAGDVSGASGARLGACLGVLLCGLLGLLPGAPAGAQSPRSGFDDMGPDLQAMQRDDARNPAMLWVQEGEALWGSTPAPGRSACAECHGSAQALARVVGKAPAQAVGQGREAGHGGQAALGLPMATVVARYPQWDDEAGTAITLDQRVNRCRVRHQGQRTWGVEQREMLSVLSWLGSLARGQTLSAPADPRLAPLLSQGQALFGLRMGQLNLSCAQCHDERAGRRLGGATIPQGHSNGYPLYRLEWQGVGSLQRRLRACMVGMRAEPFEAGSSDAVALELVLRQRGAGLRVESPAVRP